MTKLNTLISGATLSVAVALPSGAILAQDSAPNTAINGYVELEYVNGDTGSETILFGDVNLGFGMPGGGIGFDVGLQALANKDDEFGALYGALTYTMGPHKFSIGVPRSAFDSMNNMPPVGGIRTFDFLFAELNGGLTEAYYLFDEINAPTGIRYDGNFGDLMVAASAHWIDEADAHSQALAFRYKLPQNFTILGDAENIDAGLGSVLTTRIGAEADFGQYMGGVSYFNRDLTAAPHIDGTETWFSYLPTDRITVTGTALNTNVFDIYGVSLKYDWPVGDSMPGGAYAQIGAADGRATDTTYDLSIGFEF
jgi:hypothetical protein